MKNCQFALTFAITLIPHVWCQHSLSEIAPGKKGCVPGQDNDATMMRMKPRSKIDSVTNGTIFCETGQAGEFPCNSVDLRSFLNIIDLFDGYSQSIAMTSINDVWGWTSPDTGNEYALLGSSEGTLFIDISVPENPIILGMLPTHTISSSWFDMKTYSNHAFIVSEAFNHGMQVYNLLQLDELSRETRNYNLQETAYYNVGSSHNIVINEDSGYAYIVGAKTCNGGLHMVDISDPINPSFAGCFRMDGYTHDAQCVNYDGPDSNYAGREICFCSNESKLTIVDVTNKLAPKLLSRMTYEYSYWTYTHQGWLTEDKSLFLFGDEVKVGLAATYIVDVTDLTNPELKQQFCQPFETNTHNQYVKGSYSYQSNYRSGLRILDVDVYEETGTFQEEAFFDTYPLNDELGYDGTWSNYPWFDSGNVIVSGIKEGLFVVKPHFNYESSTTVRKLHAEIVDDVGAQGKLSQSMHVTITIRDHNDNPVVGAEVSGAFYHGIKKAHCYTDSYGRCVIRSKSLPNGINDITFNVHGIMYPYHSYDKKNNVHTSIKARKSGSGFEVIKAKDIALEFKKRSNLWAVNKFLDKLKHLVI